MNIILALLFIGLFTSILGYVLAIVREKYYLKKNIIIIDNKNIKREDFKDLNAKKLSYKGIKMKTGDEVLIFLEEEDEIKGTLLGANFNKGMIKIIDKTNKIEEVYVENIIRLKVTREYGKFFTFK